MANIFEQLSGLLGNVGIGASANTLGGITGALGSFAGLEEALGNIQAIPGQLEQQAQQFAQQGGEAVQFQPFAVTTGTGSAQFGPSGGLSLDTGLNPLTQALQGQAETTTGQMGMSSPLFGQISQQALQQAQSALGQATPTAQSLFTQMQSARQPEQERRRLELENRLAAQGRLGTQTAAYGGTPEALAMEKAIQEQQASDILSATTLAPQLAQQQQALASGLFGLGSQAAAQPTALEAGQIQNIAGLLSASGIPQTQLLQALTPALTASQLAQAGGVAEAELLGTLGPAVMQGISTAGQQEAQIQLAQVEAALQALGLDQQSANLAAQAAMADQAAQTAQDQATATQGLTSALGNLGQFTENLGGTLGGFQEGLLGNLNTAGQSIASSIAAPATDYQNLFANLNQQQQANITQQEAVGQQNAALLSSEIDRLIAALQNQGVV